MKSLGILLASVVWVLSWLAAPAAWWLDSKILDEQAFAESMAQVLQIQDVDTEISNRTTAEVMISARTFVEQRAPMFSGQADFVLTRAEPVVSSLVTKAVNSQPGQKAMLSVATQMHNVFLAWLESDTLGRPGLQADLQTGQATLDVDQMLQGQRVTVGPVSVPLDALDIPGISVPVPLPPDWMRLPLNVVRGALIPSLIAAAAAGLALVWLDRWRLRTLAVVAMVTAAICGSAALFIRGTWTLSGAGDADWTITRAIGELMVTPWVTAYVWVVVAMAVLATVGFVTDSVRGRRGRAAVDS